MQTLPPVEAHPDSNAVRLMVSKSYRERQEKVRWLERLAREDADGECREWPWATNNFGYGMIRWGGKVQKVGHVVLELSGQSRPPSAFQLHSCDNPPCCAPWHLRWGDHAENMRDCIERGRGRRAAGTRNGLAKLTEADVLAIRAATGTVRSIAAQYGVEESVAGKIRNGKTWRHLLNEEK